MQDSTITTSLLASIPTIPALPSGDATPAAPSVDTSPAHVVNSVDATTGQPIVARVNARKLELETLLAALPDTEVDVRRDIDLALATINSLLTGDLENVPPVVAVDMNRWLERNKHLAERVSP
jgi:hypothetical protein